MAMGKGGLIRTYGKAAESAPDRLVNDDKQQQMEQQNHST